MRAAEGAADAPAPAAGDAAAPVSAALADAGVQFLPLHSRVGKRFQATLPALQSATKRRATHAPTPQFLPERAEALGDELERYLKLARTLRDGATFDSQEQVDALALQQLHRFDYNATDAACALYARHSIELPRSKFVAPPGASRTPAEQLADWLAEFYQLMRVSVLEREVVARMKAHFAEAQAHADICALTEAAVLGRLVARVAAWEERTRALAAEKAERGEIVAHLYAAGNLQLVAHEKDALERRVRDFDAALERLKDAIDRGSRRGHAKVGLDELEALYAAATEPNIAFPDENRYAAVVHEARALTATIAAMLREEKVSLPAMRDVLAKLELVPVNFEREVDLFQQKMLSAQTWLAKARKCIPKRRVSRRGAGNEPRKLDLDAIRALVDDAPCDDSAEMFEMQDLLECADEWAEKVKRAIEGGAEVPLDELKELLDEGNEMPVDMEEQKFLEAEIAAREWCAKATAALAARRPLKALESVAEDAKAIRARIHPKKQARWKPQVERDIHAAIDAARRWVNEVRDVLGPSAFDRLLSSSAASSDSGSSHSSRSEASSGSSGSTHHHDKAKKPLESIAKLLDKADRLVVNVASHIDALKELQARGSGLRDEVRALLTGIGCLNDEAPAGDDAVVSATPTAASSDARDATHAVGSEAVAVSSSNGSPGADIQDFAHASALLDRVYALPFFFEEGQQLEQVLSGERHWSQRVKDALPPRQSRKKRQSKSQITLEQLEQLQAESTSLRFRFPDELKTLAKELEELNGWRVRARDAVEKPIADQIAQLVGQLRDHDLEVYEKLQAAKAKLASTRESSADDRPTSEHDPNDASGLEASGAAEVKVAGGSDDVQAAPPLLHTAANGAATPSSTSVTIVKLADSLLKATTTPTAEPRASEPLAPIDTEAIMSHLRLESGCMQKQKASEEEERGADTISPLSENAGHDAPSLLEPVLAMAEASLEEIAVLENRDERVSVLEDVELPGDAGSRSAFTDDAVKALEAWQEHVAQVVEDGELLSAVAPELHALSTVVDLVGWLQSARSLFYDEMLPLSELVVRGRAIATALPAMRSATTSAHFSFSATTVDTLEAMLWPLPHLEAQAAVVQSWTARVSACIAAKRVRVQTLQALLDEGDALLMEADAFRIIQDEARKAKAWLSKLKKRVKALMTKRATRLTLSVARAFVDEGEDVAIETPVFDHLKEHVELASDWETRVLASGLETGQARVATLVGLLNEYDCAGLLIDLDMHRDVLKSATERYCICRQPFDGLMIGCDWCDDWFHDNCIGMSKEKAEKVEDYTCPSCTILQDLSHALREAAVAQPTLWSRAEHAKDFEKHHGVLTRKLKREEKAVERYEAQLLSATTHLTQLRAGIDEVEKAKAALAARDGRAPVLTTTGAEPATATAAVVHTATVEAPHQPPPQQASGASDPAPSSSIVKAENGSASAAAPTSSASAATPPPAQSAGFAQSFPTILLPGGSKLPASSAPVALPLAASASVKPELKQAVERVAAGGDIDAQLPKLRAEHADAMSKTHEAQESLRLSRERLQLARDGLRELRSAHEARERGLPLAQDWVRRAVAALNTRAWLSRPKLLPSGGYLPAEYAALVAELGTQAQAQAQWTARVDAVFPEVRAYERLLRLVGWSLVVVSLLQERPSRASLSSAIAYAAEHGLWEAKTVGPLKGVLGRLDAWVAKVHKSVSKSGLSKAQKVPRLRLFLNEYSKLPLTCTPLADVLEQYITAAEAETASGSRVSEDVKQAHDAAESALFAAFTDAAATLSAAGASASASSSGASTALPKPPRKRAYTRKEKSPGPPNSAKKSKKNPPPDPAPAAAGTTATTRDHATSNGVAAKV
ncbi:hypothetical protein PybrP1_008010 [[Pythium] brassicae (nom. inval.)]|nr:hypothetical protein PybrP1_008010 [[Pythium] brassicae (nom. inval.)]